MLTQVAVAVPTVVITDDLPMVAATCPACDGHNVSDANGPGVCGDCGLTDNLSAFMGGGMTGRAKFRVSPFAKSGGKAQKFPRAFTISGNVD
jgi:hypothetical protein